MEVAIYYDLDCLWWKPSTSRSTNQHSITTWEKIYTSEIFNSLLGADRPSDRSVQMADLDLPQGHTHLTMQTTRFSTAVCLAN